jgi:hypothetical protein
MREKRLQTLYSLTVGIVALSLLSWFTCVSSRAEDVRYPVPSYEGEALEQVKQWEKTWAGKKIDPTNIDGVKELVPKSLYSIIKDPEKWGEVWFEIVPYRQIMPTKGDLEFTKKYG